MGKKTAHEAEAARLSVLRSARPAFPVSAGTRERHQDQLKAKRAGWRALLGVRTNRRGGGGRKPRSAKGSQSRDAAERRKSVRAVSVREARGTARDL